MSDNKSVPKPSTTTSAARYTNLKDILDRLTNRSTLHKIMDEVDPKTAVWKSLQYRRGASAVRDVVRYLTLVFRALNSNEHIDFACIEWIDAAISSYVASDPPDALECNIFMAAAADFVDEARRLKRELEGR